MIGLGAKPWLCPTNGQHFTGPKFSRKPKNYNVVGYCGSCVFALGRSSSDWRYVRQREKGNLVAKTPGNCNDVAAPQWLK